MKITQREIESVSSLNPFDRYKYFIKRVADFEVMYTLVDERGRFAISEVEGNIMLSFWSAQEYAIINAANEWKNYRVQTITLGDFEKEVIDLISEQNYLLNIFPINDKTGFVVNIGEFAKDLASEMKKYN